MPVRTGRALVFGAGLLGSLAVVGAIFLLGKSRSDTTVPLGPLGLQVRETSAWQYVSQTDIPGRYRFTGPTLFHADQSAAVSGQTSCTLVNYNASSVGAAYAPMRQASLVRHGTAYRAANMTILQQRVSLLPVDAGPSSITFVGFFSVPRQFDVVSLLCSLSVSDSRVLGRALVAGQRDWQTFANSVSTP